MKLNFWKYQGNGNDFVIIDDLKEETELSPRQIQKICDRHFGIGADGLMLLRPSGKFHFKMLYYNSDGNLASMCGNGGRCIAAFAFQKKIAPAKMTFDAYDGMHEAIIEQNFPGKKEMDVSLKMADVKKVENNGKFYFLDTGSPHYVEFVDKVAEFDVVKEGRKTRQSERFSPDGTNVNFVELSDDRMFVRTYERGVEDETLSCGTGVTASAIVAFLESGKSGLKIHTTGGDFSVKFENNKNHFSNIWLRGPAKQVFRGEIEID
ncbi:MAG TPA: diaminopimelate epimerase [Bacteroidales bacterium]